MKSQTKPLVKKNKTGTRKERSIAARCWASSSGVAVVTMLG
jgi:hypothetical protein